MPDFKLVSKFQATGGQPEAIDLTGLTVITYDDRRQTLIGTYSPSQLAELFAEQWIPYLECQKRGRHTYCKFTKPHPYSAPRSVGRLAEIKCGVVEAVIDNYVHGVFPLLGGMSRNDLQNFLDGSYHLVRFVYDAELHIGHMLSEDFVQWLGNAEYRAFFFGSTAHLRAHLDGFARELLHLEPFQTRSTIILTEGASEKAFLEKLSESRLFWFTDLDVQSYHGTGNRGPTKLQLLARRLYQQGYQLFIQGDCDGRARDIFEQLVNQGIVEKGNTFAFAVDFESAIPVEVLQLALAGLGHLGGIEPTTFREIISNRSPRQSVRDLLKTEFKIEVDKVALAEAAASALNNSLDAWAEDSPLWSSEIGQFLDKIRRLPRQW